MPSNKYFKNFNDQIVVCKNNSTDNEYDNLVFASRNIKTFTIPPTIKKISPFAFSSSIIESIFISPQLKEIGESAFAYCNQLKTIEIPINSEINKIDSKAFYSSSIESVTIPSHLSVISKFSFSICRYLHQVIIPSNSELQIIEEGSFYYSSIEKVFIPSHVNVEVGPENLNASNPSRAQRGEDCLSHCEAVAKKSTSKLHFKYNFNFS